MRLRPRRENWQAFGTALSLEALAVGGLLSWCALHPATPPLHVLPLEIEAPSPVQDAPPPPPPAPAPPPVPITQPRQHTPPSPTPVPQLPATPEPAPVLASPVPAPAVAAAPTPPSPPPAPAPTPVAPVGPSDAYKVKVSAAVQAAFEVPLAAKAVGFQGRTRVVFTLHGATPVGARVVISSGLGVADHAALHAVQTASYPPTPPEMKGADTLFEIWVEIKP